MTYAGVERRRTNPLGILTQDVLDEAKRRAAERAVEEAAVRVETWAQGLEEGAMAIAAEAAAVVRGAR